VLSVDVYEVDGLWIVGRARGGWRAQRPLSRYAHDVVIRGRSARWDRKPVAEAERISPEWFRQLRFAFTVLVDVVAWAPGVGPVESLRFVNPPAGFVFIDEDTVPIRGAIVEGAVRHAAGNCMEGGRLVVNDRWETRFDCDCLGRVDVRLTLPAVATWLDRRALEERLAARARELGVSPRVGIWL
jgi:hypothetical protein